MSKELFDLIKTMKQSEKRYFKLNYASFNAKAKYIDLFDAIDKSGVYDEKIISKKTGFRNFHAAKTYLYKNILLT